MCRYEYRQKGTAWRVMAPIALVGASLFALVIYLATGDRIPFVMLVFFAALTGAFWTLTLHHLIVRDEGPYLLVKCGPVALWSRRIPYRAITGVRFVKYAAPMTLPQRTFVVTWFWPPRGFDAVVITVGKTDIYIAIDDAEGLMEFLREATSDEGQDLPPPPPGHA